MQKIILFIEPNDDAFMTPAKIGDIFMNRFAIDENASCEILKKFELGKTSFDMHWSRRHRETRKKGMDHFILSLNNQI